MSIELSQNENIITVICNDKGELGMLTKDELEDYIYENLTEAVDISDEMFNEFRKNGRLDITIKKETDTVIEQQPNISANPFVESTTETKETANLHKVEIAKYSIFNNGNGKDAGTILMDFLEQDYFIIEAKIRRGKSAYKVTREIQPDGQISTMAEVIGIIRINLLEKICGDIEVNSTGMDSRIVRDYFIKKVNDEYHLSINCIFDDGDINGVYRLISKEAIREKLRLF